MRTKNKKNYAGVFVSLFIAFIMVTSILGYIFGDSDTRTSKYKDIKFTLTTQGWTTKINGAIYHFTYTPTDIESINMSDEIALSVPTELDVTYDYNSSYRQDIAGAIFELATILSKKNIYVRQGFTSNTSYNFPVINCTHSSQFVPVVYYMESNRSSISQQGNCIIVQSQDRNFFLLYSDFIAYKILGIM
jgi:hypothetical protein